MIIKKSKDEILKNLTTNMERERIRLNLTQAEMARKLDISLSTYLNIVNRKVNKIDFWVIFKLCHLTDKFIFELCGEADSPRQNIVSKTANMSKRQLEFVQAIVDFESGIADRSESSSQIEVIVPLGSVEDGMLWDSCHIELADIGSDYERFKGRFQAAIKLNSNALRPAYSRGDILLIEKRHARTGDVAIIINKQTRRAYIRRYVDGKPVELHPINQYGNIIYADELNTPEWVVFGCVLTKVRC